MRHGGNGVFRGIRARRRAAIGVSVLVVMFLVGAGVAPSVLLRSPIRNSILSRVCSQPGYSLECGSASGGWFQEVVFREVVLRDPEERLQVRVEELRTSCTMLDRLCGRVPPAAKLSLVQPEIEITVSRNCEWPRCSSWDVRTEFQFEIQDAALAIKVPNRELPIVDVGELDIRGQIEKDVLGVSWLNVSPIKVFELKALSESDCEQNLALVAPILAQSTKVSGLVSLVLDEMRIPLDGKARFPFPVTGHAEIHEFGAQLRGEWAQTISLVGGLKPDLGLPNRITALRNTIVDFELTEEGVFHKGAAFLLPEVSPNLRMVSSGTVFYDQTLDLNVSIQMAAGADTEESVAGALASIASSPLSVGVTGTISAPVLGLPRDFDLLKEISRRVTPAQYTAEPANVSTAVSDLVQDVAGSRSGDKGKRKSLAGSILNLIRAVEKKRD